MYGILRTLVWEKKLKIGEILVNFLKLGMGSVTDPKISQENPDGVQCYSNRT